jgi:hypothetical protein
VPTFAREQPPARDKLIPLRVTEAEAELIDGLARRLGLDSRSNVLRRALDLLLTEAGGESAGTVPISPSGSSPVSSERKDWRPVASSTAEEMALSRNPAKVKVVGQLREMILKLVPDCLWRRRGDGKITFTPVQHKDRSTRRNLMTVHLYDNPLACRIENGKPVILFSDDKLPEIEERPRRPPSPSVRVTTA